jgi:hypothetical protein
MVSPTAPRNDREMVDRLVVAAEYKVPREKIVPISHH